MTELQAWLLGKSGLRNYAEVHNKVVDAFVSQKYSNIPLPPWAANVYGPIYFSYKVVLSTGQQKGMDGAKLLRWVNAVSHLSNHEVNESRNF